MRLVSNKERSLVCSQTEKLTDDLQVAEYASQMKGRLMEVVTIGTLGRAELK
jgi:hypothetical protein